MIIFLKINIGIINVAWIYKLFNYTLFTNKQLQTIKDLQTLVVSKHNFSKWANWVAWLDYLPHIDTNDGQLRLWVILLN